MTNVIRGMLLLLFALLSASADAACDGESADVDVAEAMTRAERGPFVVANEKTFEDVRSKVKTDDRARTWWNAFRSAADKLLLQPVVIPPRGAAFEQRYVCTNCFVKLEPISLEEHTCKKCGRRYTGWPFADAYFSELHMKAATMASDCALAFRIALNPGYAERAKEILLKYADVYHDYCPHGIHGPGPLKLGPGKRTLCGRAFDQALCEAIWLLKLLEAYDGIATTLTDGERTQVKDRLIRPAAEIIHYNNYGVHNHECWQLSAYGIAGLVLGDQRLVASSLDHERGLMKQLEDGVLDDGLWIEGSPGYHFYVIRGLLPLVTAMSNLGYAPPRAFKRMFDAPFGLLSPTWQIPAFNDSSRMRFYRGSYNNLYEHAASWWRDSAYAWWVGGGDRATKECAIYGNTSEVGACPFVFGNAIYPQSGIAVMRSRSSQADQGPMPDNYLAIDFGPPGGGHGHPDKLNFVLWSKELISEDPGCINLTVPKFWNWHRATLAHNTLVMDGKNQLPAQGRCFAWAETNGLSLVACDAGGAYKGANVARLMVISGNLVIDYLWAEANANHTWELPFHARGSVETDITLSALKMPPPDITTRYGFGHDADGSDAWNWTKNVREGAYTGQFNAFWRKKNGETLIGISQRAFGSESGEYNLRVATGDTIPIPDQFDLAVSRTSGSNVSWLTVLQIGQKTELTASSEIRNADGSREIFLAVGNRRFHIGINVAKPGCARINFCTEYGRDGTQTARLVAPEINLPDTSSRGDVRLAPQHGRYNWQSISPRLSAGERYVFSATKISTFGRQVQKVQVRLYDLTEKTTSLVRNFDLKESAAIKWEFQVPPNAADNHVIVYAGTPGDCDGVGVVYHDVRIELAPKVDKHK